MVKFKLSTQSQKKIRKALEHKSISFERLVFVLQMVCVDSVHGFAKKEIPTLLKIAHLPNKSRVELECPKYGEGQSWMRQCSIRVFDNDKSSFVNIDPNKNGVVRLLDGPLTAVIKKFLENHEKYMNLASMMLELDKLVVEFVNMDAVREKGLKKV